jgi:hypothetical protein
VTINPVLGDLLARASNRLVVRPKHTTTDIEVAHRIGLVFDADPKRPAGISATDAEKALARERIDQLVADLARRGWPDPILADSGNGFHARYRIDVANNDGARDLVERVLATAAAKFSTDKVAIDAKLSNAARIIKLYGTMSRKGDHTDDRPHRWSRVVSIPEGFQVVPIELLESFAAEHSSAAAILDGAGDESLKNLSNLTIQNAATAVARARAYVFSSGFPDSVAGENGHDALYRCACELVDGFGLPRTEALAILREWNLAKARPPENEKQVVHKIDDAIKNHPVPSLKRLNADSSGAREGAPPLKRGAESQAQVLLRLAGEATLFHDPSRRAFATIPVGGHVETHAVRTSDFRLWLKGLFYSEQSRPPAAQAVEDALGMLEAQAVYKGVAANVHVRVARDADRIFIDLADEGWRCVEITTDGWQLISRSSVRFRRPRGLLALPAPERAGSLEALKQYVNCVAADFILILAWLAAALRPTGPYPVLVLTGEQGSAKSTVASILKSLIDPCISVVRSSPRDERDLAIAASNCAVLALDNVSSILPWLSDALCRLSTGGGFATRELYSDDQERVFDAQRPIILNGITDFVDRADLMDRSIFIQLSPIADTERREEREIWTSFKAVAPMLLGALFDAVASGLKLLDEVKLESAPRMADFARFGEAVSQALGKPPGEFLERYRDNRKSANESALDDSPIAAAVRKLVFRAPWAGSASDLLDALNGTIHEKTRESKRWPKSPRGMGGAVRRLAPQLRMVGVDVQFQRTRDARTIEIKSTDNQGNQPSPQSQQTAARENKHAPSDAPNGQPAPTVTEPALAPSEKKRRHDYRDAHDGLIPDFLSGEREIIEL